MKKFASAVILLLCAELLLPYAYAPLVSADEAGVEEAGYCGGVTVHKISDDDRQRLWDATLGFTATEINDLARQDALANDLSFDNPMNAPAKNLGFYAQSIPVTQLATLLGEDPRDTAVQLGLEEKLVQGKVPEGLEVDIVTARAYAESRGQKSEFVDSLRELGLLPPAGSDATVETNPVNELKITLPESGNEIALSDLYKLEAQNPESCFLDETFAGRASYAALLNDDLAYGTYSEEITSGEYVYAPTGEVNDDEDDSNRVTNQHFTADRINGMLSLNGGDNIVIPSFYEQWVSFSKWINDVDFYLGFAVGLGTSAAASSANKKLEKIRRVTKEKSENLARFFERTGANPEIANIDKNVLDSLARVNSKSFKDLSQTEADKLIKEASDYLNTKFTGNQQVLQALGIDPANIQTKEELMNAYQKLGLGQSELDELMIKQDELFSELKVKEDEILALEKQAPKLESISKIAGKRLTTSLAYGIGWLGAGKMMYELSDFMLLNAQGKGDDKYVRLMVNRKVASRFDYGTGMMGLSDLFESLGAESGAYPPDDAFNPGKIILINKAEVETNSEEYKQSSTTIKSSGDGWSITTDWRGDSNALNFEDIQGKGSQDFTELALKTNEILPSSMAEKSVATEIFEYATVLGVPLLLSVPIYQQVGKGFGVSAALFGLMLALDVTEGYGEGSECTVEDYEEIKDNYRFWYSAATVAEIASQVWLPFTKLKLGSTKISSTLFSKSVTKVLDWASPVQLAVIYFNGLGTEYVTNCKDSQYKILAYNKLEGGEEPAASETTTDQITGGIESLTDALGVGSASETSYAGAATEEQLQGMSEILNFKAVMTNQAGALQPEELYYFQIEESAWSVKGGLFDKLEEKGCVFTENYQNGDQTVSLSTDGIYVYNEDGSVRLALTDYWSKVRALSRMRSQENGLVVLPNKIIQAPLNCDGEFIEVNGAGTAEMSSGCETGKCLLEAIEGVLGREIGDDLSSAIGTVSSVDTTEGTATFSDSDGVRFLYLGNEYAETLKELQETSDLVDEYSQGADLDAKRFGIEVTAPAANGEATHLEVLASKLTVNGDGSTEVSGSGTNPTEIGEFRTLYGSRGKIEFDGSNLMVFIYSLAETSAQNLRDVSAAVNDEGEIELSVDAKTGAEEVEDELNAALEQIRGEDGIQVLETEDKIYYLTDDGKLRVMDKETGEAKEYEVTGVSTDSDGNLVIDTPEGPFRFGLGMQNGQPMLSAQGPDGLNEVLALLAARGSEGMLSFNPSTGAINVYNGQDVPLSADFQKKGISFMGDDNGNTYGVPANNPFTTDWSTTGTSSKRTGLTLSAWPENGWLAALMMLFVLAGVAFVRKTENNA